jgi:hypothetical protein
MRSMQSSSAAGAPPKTTEEQDELLKNRQWARKVRRALSQSKEGKKVSLREYLKHPG